MASGSDLAAPDRAAQPAWSGSSGAIAGASGRCHRHGQGRAVVGAGCRRLARCAAPAPAGGRGQWSASGAGGTGAWRWGGPGPRRLADAAGYRDGAPAGDLWPAHRPGRRLAVWPARRAGALGAVARTPAVVTLGLRSGHDRSAGLWLAGRCRRAGTACLPDAGRGAALAPALSPPWGLFTPVAGASCRVAGRAVGCIVTWFLAVICCRGHAYLLLQCPLGWLAALAGLDACPMGDRHRLAAGVAGHGLAGEPERAAGQPCGSAVDQPGGVAFGATGHIAAAAGRCRGGDVVAGGWPAGGVVPGAGAGS
ncbi:hypothetical protein D3C80_1061830 [compost metagenome]